MNKLQLDLETIRADCASCQQILHFNNAGCSLSPKTVTDAVSKHLILEQRVGGYEAADLAHEQQENFYRALSTLLGCNSEDVAFVENATRAWEMALYSLPLKAGDQILTGEMEYASNYLALLHLAKQRQVEIVRIPADSEGQIDLDFLRNSITTKTRAVALTHVASQRGDIQPASKVGEITREHGLFYLLDACQSAGQLQLDVQDLGCDFLCGTGRKYLRGPRGTGFLYVNPAKLAEFDPVFIDLHSASWVSEDSYQLRADARRFETFERFVAGQIGLGCAIDYANQIGMKAIESRVSSLAQHLHRSLQSLDAVTVLEKSGNLSGIVTFSKRDESAQALRQRLMAENINSSISKQANAQLDLAREGVGDVNRLSLHYFNTEQEIERVLEVIAA